MSKNRKLVPYKIFHPAVGEPFDPPTDAAGLFALFLRGKTENTRKNYRWDLEHFARFMREDAPEDALRKLLAYKAPQAHAVVLAYIAQLQEQPFFRPGDDPETSEPAQIGYATSTINRKVYAVRAVVDLARVCGLVDWDLDGIKMRKAKPVRDTRGPGPEGYARILAVIEEAVSDARRRLEESPKHKRIRREIEIACRDLVLVRLLHEGRLRREDATYVEWPLDVKLDEKKVSALGKGEDRPSWRYVGTACAEAIRMYLEFRGTRRGYLLRGTHPSYPNRRMNVATVNKRVEHWAERAGVSTTPHGFRHTAITAMLDRTNGNYRKTAQWSGHRDPNSLRPYDDARLDPDLRRLTDEISAPTTGEERDD